MADNSYKLEVTLSNGSIINAGTIVAPQGEAGKNGVTFIPSVSEAGVLSWTNDGGLTNPDPVNIKGDAAVITESDVAGWGFTKNAGTITEIKMNGSSKGTSGVIDLGMVLTEHQSLENYVTLDGTQDITGKKTFITNSSRALYAKSNNIDLSTPPTSGYLYNYIDFIDSSGKGRIGIVGSLFDTSGYAGTYMQAQNKATMGIKSDASGNVKTWTYTPPVDDNSTQIATTNWVRNFADPLYARGADQSTNYKGYYKIAEATLNEWYRCSVARIFVQDVDSSENGVLNVSVYAGSSTIDNVLTSVTTVNMGFLEGVNPNAYFGDFFVVVRKKSLTVRGSMKVELWYRQPNTWGRISFSFLTDIPDSRNVSVTNKWTKFYRTTAQEQAYVSKNVVDLDNGFIPYDSFTESAFVTDDYPVVEFYDNSTNQAQFTAGALRIANSQYAKDDTPTTTSGRELYFTDKNNSQLARVQATIGANWNGLNLILENKNKVAKAIEYVHDTITDNWHFRPANTDTINLGTSGRRWNDAYFKTANADSITLSTTDGIKFAGTADTRSMIKFVDAGVTYGMGILIGNGGLVMLGSGESVENLQKAITLAGDTEQTFITSDNAVRLFSNCNTIANRKELSFNNSGQLVYTPTAGGTSYTYTLPTKTGTLATTSDINNGTLTIQKNGTNVATFSANQSAAATANIEVPEALSDLENDMKVIINYSEKTNSWALQGGGNVIGAGVKADSCIAIGSGSIANYERTIKIGSLAATTPTNQSVTQIGVGRYSSSGRALYLGAGDTGFTYMNSAGSSWTSASDIRDKADIEEIVHALDFIKKLKPITYVMNDRERYLIRDENDNPILDSNGKQQYDVEAHKRGDKKKHRRFAGLSAQDTYQAMLDCYDNNSNYAQIVDNNKFDHPDDEYIEQYSMSYERLVPFLIKAIQEQQAQIDALKIKMAS